MFEMDWGGPRYGDMAEKSVAAIRREDQAKSLFNTQKSATEEQARLQNQKTTVELLTPSCHLTGACWKSFSKYVRENKGWSIKRVEATDQQKRASGEKRKGKVYFVSVTFDPTATTSKLAAASSLSSITPGKKRLSSDMPLNTPTASAKKAKAPVQASSSPPINATQRLQPGLTKGQCSALSRHGFEGCQLLMAAGKKPVKEYMLQRVQAVAGHSIAEALHIKVLTSKGETSSYKMADLKYDIQRGFLNDPRKGDNGSGNGRSSSSSSSKLMAEGAKTAAAALPEHASGSDQGWVKEWKTKANGEAFSALEASFDGEWRAMMVSERVSEVIFNCHVPTSIHTHKSCIVAPS